ncbi:MAG TPA: DUF2934 domain-containing protein [Gammaproteobacteria bacterium]|nr:DUF2934 domain-containing protein [Gammaproteobacteria bacterium]
MVPKKKKAKKVASKPASKVKAAKKKAARKTARKIVPKKSPTKKTPPPDDRIKVTLEQRHKMICEAAYYISLEKTYETVNPTEDWLQAEAFISKICTVHAN